LPPRLSAPDLASVRILSERGTGDHHAVALTVDDATGERYRIVRELVRDLGDRGGWRVCSGCEGLERVIAGKPDPYVGFYAYAAGHFFASRTGTERIDRPGPDSSGLGVGRVRWTLVAETVPAVLNPIASRVRQRPRSDP
jgi:hypothetical protein